MLNNIRQISDKQLEANRRNAQKSTGPRTEEGKARCAQNAFRHGLTGQISVKTEEDRIAFDQFTKSLIADLKPEGALESQLAFAIAEGHWRLNRIRGCEDNIFALGHYSPAADIETGHPELHAALTSAQAFLASSREFERLTLYEQRILRTVARHTQELEALQLKRKTAHAQALEEAAKLLQVAEFYEEVPQNGSEFSIEEIRAHIHRTERLSRFEYHEKQCWNPEVEFPADRYTLSAAQ